MADHGPGRTRHASLLRIVVGLVSLAALACERDRAPSRPADSAPAHAPATQTAPYRMSERGLARIREDEAFVPRVYDDGVGNETIGYGHLVRPGESFPGAISEAEGRALFARDVARIVYPALERVKVPLTQNQIDALGSFIYNAGPGNFTRSVLPAINAGDFNTATAKMAQFVRGRNQRTGERETLRGLVRRRREEIALFRRPPGVTALLRRHFPGPRAGGTALAVRRPAPTPESRCAPASCPRTPSRS